VNGAYAYGVRYLKSRPLALASGKAKTAASAAFLGDLLVCLQKDDSCCVNVTNRVVEMRVQSNGEQAGRELSTPCPAAVSGQVSAVATRRA